MNCPKCNSALKLIPSGISKKTNKPYSAFLACSSQSCGYTQAASDSPEIAVSGVPAPSATQTTYLPQNPAQRSFEEERDNRIHWEVCLKLAVKLFIAEKSDNIQTTATELYLMELPKKTF